MTESQSMGPPTWWECLALALSSYKIRLHKLESNPNSSEQQGSQHGKAGRMGDNDGGRNANQGKRRRPPSDFSHLPLHRGLMKNMLLAKILGGTQSPSSSASLASTSSNTTTAAAAAATSADTSNPSRRGRETESFSVKYNATSYKVNN